MMPYHSIYAPILNQYIAFKRSYGLKFKMEYALKELDDFFFVTGASTIGVTREQAELWGKQRPNETDSNLSHRIQDLNGVSRYLNDVGYPSYVPQPIRFHSTFIPRILTHEEIARLFKASDDRCSKKRSGISSSHILLFPITIRLLYATGMRAGELVKLTVGDVNLQDGTILIRESKNGRDRLVPVSDSMLAILRGYSIRHNVGANATMPFFRRRDGKPCGRNSLYALFRECIELAGIHHEGRGKGPRLHDVRHTAAVHSMAAMADAGLDLYYCLPLLSQYLGHSSLESTEKYVRLSEEMFPGVLTEANSIAPSVFPEVNHAQ